MPQSIRLFVRDGASVMAPFRKAEISDAGLETLPADLTRRSNSAAGRR
jgi:hypothetical protein